MGVRNIPLTINKGVIPYGVTPYIFPLSRFMFHHLRVNLCNTKKNITNIYLYRNKYIYLPIIKIRNMKGRMILAITVAILALILAIWCFIDGTYYIGVFALFICIAQVCNYFLIKKKRYWYDPKTHYYCTCFEYHCLCVLHCFFSNEHHR